MNSIKILRQVDPTGVLLEAVSGPTREYLQGRKDTIRSIVTAMTDDKSEVAGESLFDELQRPAQQVICKSTCANWSYASGSNSL